MHVKFEYEDPKERNHVLGPSKLREEDKLNVDIK
jgi:hypothetical protein